MADQENIQVDLLGLSDEVLDNLIKSGAFFPPVSGLIETVRAMSSNEAIKIGEAGEGMQYRIPVPVSIYEQLVS